MQIAEFKINIQALDLPTDRRRWNGAPMASEEASEALAAAVDATQDILSEYGFQVVRTSYGVSAFES